MAIMRRLHRTKASSAQPRCTVCHQPFTPWRHAQTICLRDHPSTDDRVPEPIDAATVVQEDQRDVAEALAGAAADDPLTD